MPFKLEVGDRSVVISGFDRLTRESAQEFRTIVQEHVTFGNVWVVVDLAGVDSVDSTGLGVLVECLRLTRQAGGDLRMARADGRVLGSMEQTSLDVVFRTFPSVEKALENGPSGTLPPRRPGRLRRSTKAA